MRVNLKFNRAAFLNAAKILSFDGCDCGGRHNLINLTARCCGHKFKI